MTTTSTDLDTAQKRLHTKLMEGLRWKAKKQTPADAATEPTTDLPVEPGKRAPADAELSMRYAHRNLIVNSEGTWAFYALDGVDWTLQSPDARRSIITDQMFRWADLIGHKIWLRGLSR